MNERFRLTKETLSKVGIRRSTVEHLPPSSARFSDGGHFRIEVPTVNSANAAETILNRASKVGVRVNRVTETLGMFRHCASEIKDYVSLCASYGSELYMSVGPRATYDTSASSSTSQGSFMGYRLRGPEQLRRAVEDVRRGVELGVNGVVVYDEGLLWMLSLMREEGELPKSLKFKVSAHCGHGNPAAALLMQSLGANSFNPVRDLPLSDIAAIREVLSIPIDLHTDNPRSSGGFIRFYEAPDFIRIAAPLYLKVGNSVLSSHGAKPTTDDALAMIDQVRIVLEMIERFAPEAIQSGEKQETADVQNIRVLRL